MLRALRTLLVQFFLGVIGQPVLEPLRAERVRYRRKEERLEVMTRRAGLLAALQAVARKAFLALLGQPSSEPRSAASRRRPRS